MKNTPLIDKHKELGAKIVEFAGFNMPIEYSGLSDEHVTVRERVGIFDVSHMGEFWIKGPHALELIQKVSSNDASRLQPGKAQYTTLPNGQGGIVDDFLVYQYDQQKYMVVVNAANIRKDWDWFSKQNTMRAELEDASGQMSLMAVQGPYAQATMEKLTDEELAGMKPFRFKVGKLAGVDNVIISSTGYTGEHGFELYVDNQDAPQIWDVVLEAGKEFGIKPVGLGARDTLRLEAGLCLYGNDIDETTSPIEAGLGFAVKFKDYKDFIDKDHLWKQKQEGVSKKLVGFIMQERGIPRQHYEIMDANGQPIGEVTSGTMSPMIKQGIGMGYVPTEYAVPDQEIYIKIRRKVLKAKVVKMPIFKKS
ncbi:MAG: glycine cleavage system aminomethyltransferase GcvT [Bacteroidales bacterium]|nr:glycine cleavage system aminomethyltransferase GcvT [Bacteroidales bacterium]